MPVGINGVVIHLVNLIHWADFINSAVRRIHTLKTLTSIEADFIKKILSSIQHLYIRQVLALCPPCLQRDHMCSFLGHLFSRETSNTYLILFLLGFTGCWRTNRGKHDWVATLFRILSDESIRMIGSAYALTK